MVIDAATNTQSRIEEVDFMKIKKKTIVHGSPIFSRGPLYFVILGNAARCAPLKIPQNASEDDIRVLFFHVVLSMTQGNPESSQFFLQWWIPPQGATSQKVPERKVVHHLEAADHEEVRAEVVELAAKLLQAGHQGVVQVPVHNEPEVESQDTQQGGQKLELFN